VLRLTDPRTQIPPDGLLPFRPKRARPYLYSKKDIQRLLAAAREMPCRYTRCKLRPWTYYCLFGLLSLSGLRLSEARNLKLSDIDFETAVLTIRGTKFGKSRLVPMHASTCAVLQDYLKRRRQHCAAQATSPYLFTSQLGNRLDVGLLIVGFQKRRIRPHHVGIAAFWSRRLSRSTVSFSRGRRWRNVSTGGRFRRN
jgi:integrase/recombinase XerD